MADLVVGAHISLNSNPRSAVQAAAGSGLRAMQIFASCPGAWKPPIVDEERYRDFMAARREHGIDLLFIHSIYLINLASADPTLVRRSRASLISTLRAGQMMGATGVVTHIGSHGGRGFEAVADQIAAGLAEILGETPGGIDLILETSAGAGGIVGAHLTEVGELIDRARGLPRLKIGLDTAHLCASGWDFQDETAATRLTDELALAVGLDRLSVVHANDSKQPCGSRKDRHANIGEGYIGLEGFRHLLAQDVLRAVPWVLETPHLEQRPTDVQRLLDAAREGAASGA